MQSDYEYSSSSSSMTSDINLLSDNSVTFDYFSNYSLFSNISLSSLAADSLGKDETLNSTRRFSQSPDPGEYIFDRLIVRSIFIIVYTIVFCSCFFGNLTVILVVTLHWRMRSITNFCLANLAFANLCVGVFCICQNLSTYLITSWVFGDFMCKMYHFINSLSYTASILILVVICIERYLAIIHPIRSRQILTIRRLRVSIVGVWISSAIYCSPRLYYIGTIRIPRRDGEIETLCIPKRTLYNSQTFDIINFFLIFLVPMTVISVLYTIIGISLWRSSRNQMSTTTTTMGPATTSSSSTSSFPNHIQKRHSSGSSCSLTQIEISSADHVGNSSINPISISTSHPSSKNQTQTPNQEFSGTGVGSSNRKASRCSTYTKSAVLYGNRHSRRKVNNGNKAGSNRERVSGKEMGTSGSEEHDGSDEDENSSSSFSFGQRNHIKEKEKKRFSSISILPSRVSTEAEPPLRLGCLCCLMSSERRTRSKRRRVTTTSLKHLNSKPRPNPTPTSTTNPLSIPHPAGNCADCQCRDNNEASRIFHSQISESSSQRASYHRRRDGEVSGERGEGGSSAVSIPCHCDCHVNVSPTPHTTISSVPSISLLTSSTMNGEVMDAEGKYGVLHKQYETDTLAMTCSTHHGHGQGHLINSSISTSNPNPNTAITAYSSSLHGDRITQPPNNQSNNKGKTRTKWREKQLCKSNKEKDRDKGKYLYGDGDDSPSNNSPATTAPNNKKDTNIIISSCHEIPTGLLVKGQPPSRDNNVQSNKMKLRRVGAMKSCRIGSQALKSRRRVVRMLIVIVVTFALCNLPFHGRKLWQIWSSSYEGGSIFSSLFTPITFLIMYANCAINPILYAFMSTTFRASFRDLISCRWRHQQRAQDHLTRYAQNQPLSHHRT